MRAPVATSARARTRIMDRVRAAAATSMPRRAGARPFGGARYSIVGLALAAGIGSVTTLSALVPDAGAVRAASSAVIGDSVVGTLHDTLRLVRLIFDDRDAHRVAVVGDFNGWRASGTPLRHDAASRRWSATLALRDGEHRYAFVVDGRRWVPDDARRARTEDGLVYTVLHVARASN
jgi:hypothetical protein